MSPRGARRDRGGPDTPDTPGTPGGPAADGGARRARRKERRPAEAAPVPVSDSGRRRGVRKKSRDVVAPVVPDLTPDLTLDRARAPEAEPGTDRTAPVDRKREPDRDLVAPSGRVVLHASAEADDDRPAARPSRAGATEPERRRMRAFRFPALLVVFGLLVAAVAYERRLQPEAQQVTAADLANLMPTASPAGALSSTWFCAGGTALGSTEAPATPPTTKPAGKTPATTPGTTIPEPPAVVVAEQTIIISNQADHAQQARVTAYPSTGAPVTSVVPIGPGARTDIDIAKLVTAPYASVLVETDGGLLGVSHRLRGPTGEAVGPCATSASSSWYFPSGVTRLGVREIFLAFNPFPERAVLDFSFQVEDEGGRQSPRDSDKLKGLVVQPDSVLAIDITDLVNVREQVATQVHTRSGVGRVIIDRLLVADGEHNQPKQLSVGLGAPALADTWVFSHGAPIEPGVETTFVLYNPGTDTVSADLLVDADGPLPEIEPFDITVRPGQYATVSLAKDNRMPQGVGYWASVHSRLGGPIVVERVVTAVAPATRTGTVHELGAPLVANEWVIPVGGIDGGTGEVSVANLATDAEVTLTISLLAGGVEVPLERFDHVSLAAGMRTVVDLGELGAIVGTTTPADRSLRVRATGPVAVGETLTGTDPPQYSSFPAFPVRDTLRLPPVDLTARASTTTVPVVTGPIGSIPLTDLGTLPPSVEPGSSVAPPGTDATTVPPAPTSVDPNAPTSTTTTGAPADPNAPTTVVPPTTAAVTPPTPPTTTVAPP